MHSAAASRTATPLDRVSAAIYVLAALAGPTWRITSTTPLLPSLSPDANPLPSVLAFWHTHLLTGFFAARKHAPHALVSASRDGTRLAAVLERWGYTMLRGSSSRNAVSSLRSCVRALRGGSLLTITPDGPRGPAFIAKPGVAQIALLARVPVVTWAFRYSSRWQLGSWDSFSIPRPFARIRVTPTLIDTTAFPVPAEFQGTLLRRISEGMGQ